MQTGIDVIRGAVEDVLSEGAVFLGLVNNAARLFGLSFDEATIAELLFLLSSASARTTGSVLDVSGGSTLGARGKRAHSVRELL